MRRVQWFLWNRSERRLRTPWRLLLGTVLFVLVSIVALLGLQAVRTTMGVGLLADLGPATRPLVLSAIGGLAVLIALAAIGWNVDRRYLSDYGLRIDREWWVDCGFGLVLGGCAMTAVVIGGIAGGWFGVETVPLSTGTLSRLLGLAALFLIIGFYEELLIRGYLLTNLAEGFRWFDRLSARSAAVIAALGSSLVFGWLHAANPNATLLSTAIVSAAGLMLALGYLYTGELAIPVGIHITWNAFQGLLYGLPVSGARLPVSLIQTTPRGPATVTGGAFGPEAGLLGLGGVVFAALGVVVYCRYQYGTLAVSPVVSTPDLRGTAVRRE